MRPKHALKTGFGVEENRQIVQAFTHEFAGILLPAAPLQRDALTAKSRRTLALQSPERLRARLKDEYVAHIIARMRLATELRPLCLAICWQNETTRDAILAELRQLLGVDASGPWPAQLTVFEHRVPFDAVELLDPGALNPADVYDKHRSPDFFPQWHAQLRRAQYDRQQRWADQVWSKLTTPVNAVRLALIEIPDFSRGNAPEEQWPRDAIRASVLLNWQGTAQFLRPMRLHINPKTQQEELRGESKGCLAHAVSDLVIRHTGTMLDTLMPVYLQETGLPEVIAHEVLVTGLYRVRSQATYETPAVDYPLAARLFPDGTVKLRKAIFVKKGALYRSSTNERTGMPPFLEVRCITISGWFVELRSLAAVLRENCAVALCADRSDHAPIDPDRRSIWQP